MPSKDQAREVLRLARHQRAEILYNPLTTPVQRAQAQADFRAAIDRAYDTRTLTIREIADAAAISRQRVWQIVRDKEVQARLAPAAKQPSPAHTRLPETDL